jgi:hypothetical protein
MSSSIPEPGPELPPDDRARVSSELTNKEGLIAAGRQFFASMGKSVSDELAYEVQRLLIINRAAPGLIYGVRWPANLVQELKYVLSADFQSTDVSIAAAVVPNIIFYGVRVIAREWL